MASPAHVTATIRGEVFVVLLVAEVETAVIVVAIVNEVAVLVIMSELDDFVKAVY